MAELQFEPQDRRDAEGQPASYQCRVSWLRILVHRHIHYPPDKWLLSTVPDVVCKRELREKSIVLALREAVQVVRQEMRKALEAIGDG